MPAQQALNIKVGNRQKQWYNPVTFPITLRPAPPAKISLVLPKFLFKIEPLKKLAIGALLVATIFSDGVSAQTFVDRLSSDSFRLANYNVLFDTLFEPSNRDELIRFVEAVDADVYCFQEAFDTTATQARDLFDQIAPLPTGSWQVHKGRNQITLSRYPLSRRLTNVPGGTRGIAMAQVDLPDADFSNDMYILNNHFPCCDNESQRVIEATAIVNWLADAITPGGSIDLTADTAVAVVGDLNIVRGPESLNILLDGINGLTTDWDGSSMTDLNPTHNAAGMDDYTWRDDTSPFPPGILDYILYTDSVIEAEHSFVLNPADMTNFELAATGLFASDMLRDKRISRGNFDHLPLIVDFASNAAPPFILGDVNQDGAVNFFDIPSLITYLTSGEYLAEADCNEDGEVNFFDVSPFVAILSET